ncbi:MAG: endopeptidase La [Candidatus Solincola sediminis]|uniref:Lon protease n=1 Tax=Candidatus Solincola sediminis TaxID=1797199 RepID=A0A1F2WHP2_9ACTN|nr:MAG: endopeptidase La [Candidatus Solincola sediminis]
MKRRAPSSSPTDQKENILADSDFLGMTEPYIPDELPVLPLKDTVIYPHIIVPLLITEEYLVKLIDDALSADRMVVAVATKEEVDRPAPGQIYDIGTAAAIIRMLKLPDGSMQLFMQGIQRVHILEFIQEDPYLKAKLEKVKEVLEPSVEIEGLARNVLNLFKNMVTLAPYLPNEIFIAAMNITDPNNLADFIASNINISIQEKQELLEALDVKDRLEKLTVFLNKELEILEIGSKIQSQVQTELSKSQREYVLREQMKAIQKELGEEDERTMEINEFREKIDKSGMPEEARKEAERELDRLTRMPAAAAEYTVSRTYLEWLTSLPWKESTPDNLEIDQAQETLDNDHYDLEKIKDRILEYLAVRKLNPAMKGPILCFVGPPGVGKTSLGQSIAHALGRKFVRMSLGGIHDEAEIRGHRRTYIGALPGRIIQGIRKAGTNNPVFMLDEVDKIGMDFRGDPSSALLEVLDPEQNFSFSDNYLDVPFDLSPVMFITTANTAITIPPALLDRMELLELVGYTEVEKLHIAENHLIPRQLEAHGLKKSRVIFTEEATRVIIRSYTREAGVRNLEREIATICRKVAKDVASGARKSKKILKKDLHAMLGPIRFRFEVLEEEDEVGVATGLAWTEAGGDVLFVEAQVMPGDGQLILTGKLGDVMQESAKAALTYCRSVAGLYGVDHDFFKENDMHVHVPAGAIPKDGPSAGVTMATALISAITKRKVRKEVGMTGEITLRGKVLPIGGLKEKTLAAHRSGVKTVLLPAENEKYLEDIPDFIRNELEFIPVKHIEEIFKVALHPEAGIAIAGRKKTVPAKAKRKNAAIGVSGEEVAK